MSDERTELLAYWTNYLCAALANGDEKGTDEAMRWAWPLAYDILREECDHTPDDALTPREWINRGGIRQSPAPRTEADF